MAAGQPRGGKVLGTSVTFRVYVQASEDKEWASIGETLSATGRRLSPVIVLKAKNLQGQYFPRDLRNWKYDYSTNGWFKSKICLRWLREVFIPESQPRNKNYWRLLILDANFMHTAWSNKIQLIYLPSHTSHRTQPLDLAVFALLKTAHAQQTAKLNNYDHSAPIQKRRFLSSYCAASDKSITARNIRAGFKKAGIWPFCPREVLDSQDVLDEANLPTTSPQEPAIEMFHTPHKSQDDKTLVTRLCPDVDPQHRGLREVSKLLGRVFNQGNLKYAVLEEKNRHVMASLDAVQPRKRKKVKEDVNDRFARIVDIREAQEVVQANTAVTHQQSRSQSPETAHK